MINRSAMIAEIMMRLFVKRARSIFLNRVTDEYFSANEREMTIVDGAMIAVASTMIMANFIDCVAMKKKEETNLFENQEN
ncbi:unnamed protein product [Lasius platythorax]|uniref:Uncharacterized protein n=1 Tax=Lasius platythorax TaxID=488582 RepID=A0AAV2P402_9HYME